MIDEERGRIDYHESGTGPTMVLVPGSCSTGAAWRSVIAPWNGQFRTVTTSLLGYGGTAERRTSGDSSMSHEAEVLESVIRRTGEPVHLVGHSFGSEVALCVAVRNRVPLASLTVLEVPGVWLLKDTGEDKHYRTFREMTDVYLAEFDKGNAEAIGGMIDFYGGSGTFASWSPRVRSYAIETTSVNILDWATAYGNTMTTALLAAINIPVLVAWGGTTHPAIQRAGKLLAESINGSSAATIAGAAHFMIATHAPEVAELIAQHVRSAEVR